MKAFLLALAALPCVAGIAAAAEPLTNLQMDTVTAGINVPPPYSVSGPGGGNNPLSIFGLILPGSSGSTGIGGTNAGGGNTGIFGFPTTGGSELGIFGFQSSNGGLGLF